MASGASVEEADGIDVRVTVDRAGPDWRGRVGVVPELIAGSGVDPARTFAMLCGPEVMTLADLVRLTAKIADLPCRILPLPGFVARVQGMIMGLLRPDAGRITLFGGEAPGSTAAVRKTHSPSA